MAGYTGLDPREFFLNAKLYLVSPKLEAFQFTFVVLNRTVWRGLKKAFFDFFIGVLDIILSYSPEVFLVWHFLVKNPACRTGSIFNPI